MAFDFHKDLPYGEDFEYRIAKQLWPKHNCWKIDGYFKPFDLVCDDCGLTIECKTDRYRTGNMVFEVDLLNLSQADILVYEVMDKIYWGHLENVRYWIRLAITVDGLERQNMGENGNKGYIIPIKDTKMYLEEL